MYINFILIISSVLLNALAQIFLKFGMMQITPLNHKNNLIETSSKIIFNPYIFSGLTSYGISIILWLWVLSKVEVSLAYPFQALGYILVTILAWLLFQEQINLLRICALVFICIGLILLALSAGTK